jgi:hypothetical protein
MKIMVAYDGTLQAKEALVYGIEKARAKGGDIIALQVFNSPLFVDYDATVNARDAARAEAARFVEEAKAIIREKGKGEYPHPDIAWSAGMRFWQGNIFVSPCCRSKVLQISRKGGKMLCFLDSNFIKC